MESTKKQEVGYDTFCFPKSKPKFPRGLTLLLITCTLLMLALFVIRERESQSKNRDSFKNFDPWNAYLFREQDVEQQSGTNKTLSSKENSASPHSTRKLAQVVAIGVRQGGYQPLLKLLQEHPQIKIVNKSTGFFESESLFAKGLDWYQNQLPEKSEEQVLMDISPGAFSSPKALKRIRNTNQNTKLLLVLRDPMERFILELVDKWSHTSSTEKQRPTWAIMTASQYSRHLKCLMSKFSKNQICIVPYEKLISSPVQEMKRIFSFLGTNETSLDHILNQDNLHHFEKSYIDDMKIVHEYKQRCQSSGRTLNSLTKLYNKETLELVRITGDEYFKNWIKL